MYIITYLISNYIHSYLVNKSAKEKNNSVSTQHRHEYTESNLKFAIKVEPNNQSVKDRLNEVKEKRSRKEITLPSTIELEQKTNPFMRCSEDAVVKAVKNFSGKDIEDPVDVFAAVRGWKDNS